MINIVILVYKRLYFLPIQLENLQKQTVANNISLHIISNNPDIDFESVVNQYTTLNITFIQRDNSNKFFERYIYSIEKDFDYVIFLDDDMLLQPDSIEKLYAQKESKTICSCFGRNFNLNTNPYKLITSNYHSDTDYFDAALPGFSIIDCSIFPKILEEKEMLSEELRKDILMTDDLLLAWVLQKENWRMKNSKLKLLNHYPNDEHFFVAFDEATTYTKIRDLKDSIAYKLDQLHPWKKTQ